MEREKYISIYMILQMVVVVELSMDKFLMVLELSPLGVNKIYKSKKEEKH